MNTLERLMAMSEEDREGAVSDLIGNHIHVLLDTEAVSSETATTNAFDWYIDEHDIQITSLTSEECRVNVTFSAAGEQDEDKMHHGDSLAGTATAVINANGAVEFEDVTAEKNGPDDDFDPDEE